MILRGQDSQNIFDRLPSLVTVLFRQVGHVTFFVKKILPNRPHHISSTRRWNLTKSTPFDSEKLTVCAQGWPIGREWVFLITIFCPIGIHADWKPLTTNALQTCKKGRKSPPKYNGSSYDCPDCSAMMTFLCLSKFQRALLGGCFRISALLGPFHTHRDLIVKSSIYFSSKSSVPTVWPLSLIHPVASLIMESSTLSSSLSLPPSPDWLPSWDLRP